MWVAGSMVAFIGFSALAVDLGWLYLNATRLQSAADAAALAGVVHIPTSKPTADSMAASAAEANGFAGAVSSTAILDDNSYEAVLSTTINTWFLPVLGIDEFTIVKDSRAEYIKPVKLGSPDSQFGGQAQGFWAAISGQYTDVEHGDPVATRCFQYRRGATTPACDGSNPWGFDARGYYYAVDVPSGMSSLNVQFYGIGHVPANLASASEPNDTSWNLNNSNDPRWPVVLDVILYRPDSTPNDPTDNSSVICSRRNTQNGFSSRNQWQSLCTINNPPPGIYVLQLPAPTGEGSNNFALRATSPAKVYGLNQMSIHINNKDGNPTPWLAEVRPEHAGKTLYVDIYDVGESCFYVPNTWDCIPSDEPAMNLEIRGPGNTSVGCRWSAPGHSGGSLNPCFQDVGMRRFDSTWLRYEIDLPENYTCDPEAGGGTGCWWRVAITDMINPTDRTTWRVSVGGNPVRLIP